MTQPSTFVIPKDHAYHNPLLRIAAGIPFLGTIPALVAAHLIREDLIEEYIRGMDSRKIIHLFGDKNVFKVIDIVRSVFEVAITASLIGCGILSGSLGAALLGFSLGGMGFQVFAIIYNSYVVEDFRRSDRTNKKWFF